MKPLIAAALLLALASPAYALNPCDVEYDTQHDNYCLHNPSKCIDSRVDWKSVAARCGIPEEKPLSPGKIDKVQTRSAHITPYQEGMRDYREGLCYRARPYIDHGPEQKLWERGYHAQAKKKPRDMSHCYGTRGKIDNQLMRDR